VNLPTFQDLSREQLEINSLPLEASFLITGPPGTGKTVMALYRAEALTQKGAFTQLLMYSRLLANYVGSAIDELDLDGVAHTYYGWLVRFYRNQYRRAFPERERWHPDWMEILKTVNESPPAANSIPFLIIDEAQDLPKEFFMLTKHIGRHITVFADENQKLMDDNSTIGEIKLYTGIENEYSLRRNYRNTREIAQVAAHYYTGLPTGKPDLPESSGSRPQLVVHERLHDVVDFISRYERNNPTKEIGVFTATRSLQQRLVNRLMGKTSNPVQFYDSRNPETLDFDQPGIKVVNYASAKGLEFDTVFLPELQAVSGDIAGAALRMRFYVLVSRARRDLYFMYCGGDKPPVVRDLPADLIEER
jgi:DNA helicase IV